MFLKIHFVFFDYQEPLLFFMLDYIAVMGMFIFIGYYGYGRLKKRNKTKGRRKRKKAGFLSAALMRFMTFHKTDEFERRGI